MFESLTPFVLPGIIVAIFGLTWWSMLDDAKARKRIAELEDKKPKPKPTRTKR